jgi:hypothetical protein
MPKRLRPKLTFANVASATALFLALSTGGVYAANEWTGANIKNETLTGADVKGRASTATAAAVNGTLSTFDIAGQSAGANGTPFRPGTLTRWDVKDASLPGGGLHGDQDIIDNTISTFDIATNAIDSDEVLDFGLSNQDVGVLFAQVNSNGTIANSSGGGVTSLRLGVGTYEVDFGRTISGCAFVTTQGEAGVGGASGAIMGVTDRAGNLEAVFATARDAAGALADRAFQLVVVC